MHRVINVLLLAILITHAPYAIAATVSIVPETTTVNIGESFSIDLTASLAGNEKIDWYDIDLTFDDSILKYTTYTMGSGLGNMYNDLSLNPSDSNLPDGIARLMQISSSDLSSQGGTILLATLTFEALQAGLTAVDFGWIDVKNLNYQYSVAGGDLSYNAAEINVVPVPAAAWLLGSGFISLFGILRRVNNQS